MKLSVGSRSEEHQNVIRPPAVLSESMTPTCIDGNNNNNNNNHDNVYGAVIMT